MATTGVVDLFNTLRLKNLKENNSYDLVEIFTFLYKKILLTIICYLIMPRI